MDSRITAARRRAGALKRVLAGVAAAGFVAAALLARGTNPGQASRTGSARSGSTPATSSDDGSTSTFDDGSSSSSDGFSVAPSTSQPQVQTGVS